MGITGTNGKTTTSYLVDSILREAGRTTGLFGTIAYRTPRTTVTASTTTPESLNMQRFLAEVRDAGGSAAVMEASSHALAMDRLWGLRFAVAIFTNLTRDHLDYHKTFEDYLRRRGGCLRARVQVRRRWALSTPTTLTARNWRASPPVRLLTGSRMEHR